MADVVAQPLQSAPHGKKRAGDNSLEHEQRLSKRFDLLNLVNSNGTRLYIPVSGSGSGSTPTTAPPPAITPKPRPQSPPEEAMHIEDTPHRIYIADLAAELSDIPSDDEHPIFLSDIEKHLSKIPLHVLAGPTPKPTEHNQVVLYNVPASLTVPAEQDSVRKAIVETRRRIRERQGSAVDEVHVPLETRQDEASQMDNDYDAMDID
ncbi:hypothetical protein P153DRAFT_354044 [Dothidotthia symphoricarpi CBS 119687]|uniref:Uncharacterized protein n=1 Tax=Dothidotthia symphoricarpi CBS 119687 TaxID=1392245 RepID=A0A6A6AN99_9PLEO|nr:uncharacterized protein P153DRAFT_354044 [Dothidotthia symphoricarpi CBS 119687]KAF2132535.1 hypothetical protein P153DRAFT_354044 [Dothidotthia symphoricarpi CBS 119687]